MFRLFRLFASRSQGRRRGDDEQLPSPHHLSLLVSFDFLISSKRGTSGTNERTACSARVFWFPLAVTKRNKRSASMAAQIWEKEASSLPSHQIPQLPRFRRFAHCLRLVQILRLPFRDLRVAPFIAGVTLFPFSPAFLEWWKRPALPAQYLLTVVAAHLAQNKSRGGDRW